MSAILQDKIEDLQRRNEIQAWLLRLFMAEHNNRMPTKSKGLCKCKPCCDARKLLGDTNK